MPGRALLVIDMQNGFTRLGNLAHPRQEAVIGRIVPIVEEEAERGSWLIFTKDTHAPDDPGLGAFPAHCIVGTSEHDIVDELQPFAERATIIEKPRYSAFFRSDAEEILEAGQPEVVRVVGVSADVCVLHTVADLRLRDYRVEVAADGVETFDGPEHPGDRSKEWALEHMRLILKADIV